MERGWRIWKKKEKDRGKEERGRRREKPSGTCATIASTTPALVLNLTTPEELCFFSIEAPSADLTWTEHSFGARDTGIAFWCRLLTWIASARVCAGRLAHEAVRARCCFVLPAGGANGARLSDISSAQIARGAFSALGRILQAKFGPIEAIRAGLGHATLTELALWTSISRPAGTDTSQCALETIRALSSEIAARLPIAELAHWAFFAAFARLRNVAAAIAGPGHLSGGAIEAGGTSLSFGDAGVQVVLALRGCARRIPGANETRTTLLAGDLATLFLHLTCGAGSSPCGSERAEVATWTRATSCFREPGTEESGRAGLRFLVGETLLTWWTRITVFSAEAATLMPKMTRWARCYTESPG